MKQEIYRKLSLHIVWSNIADWLYLGGDGTKANMHICDRIYVQWSSERLDHVCPSCLCRLHCCWNIGHCDVDDHNWLSNRNAIKHTTLPLHPAQTNRISSRWSCYAEILQETLRPVKYIRHGIAPISVVSSISATHHHQANAHVYVRGTCQERWRV